MVRIHAFLAVASIALVTSGCASVLYNCKADDKKCQEEAKRADRLMAKIAVDTAAVAFESAVAAESQKNAAPPPPPPPPPQPKEAPSATPAPVATEAAPPAAGAPFDRKQAAAALRIAIDYAARCRGTTTGPVTVGVAFAPSGRATVTTLTGDGVVDVHVHECVRSRIEQASVAPFSDGPHTAKLSFVVEPDVAIDSR